MRETKSLEGLYDEVKDHDLVLTVDVALADALNRRLDQTVIGAFATTPRKLAYRGDHDFEKDVFLKLVDDLNLTWKQASFMLGKVLDCWKETGEVDQILEYKQYDAEKTKEIVEKLREYDTPFKAIENHEIQADDVAVVNLYQFTELDKKILPENFTSYSVFKERQTNLETFNTYGSSLELVKSLVENIEYLGAENVGVAVHPNSKYQSLLESYFNSDNISFVTQEDINSSENFRALIKLMRIGLSDRVIRVKDVNSLTDSLGLQISGKNLNTRLDSVKGLEEFKEFLNVLEFLEVEQVIEKMEKLSGESFDDTRNLVGELGLLNMPVSSEVADKILDFVNSFDVVADQENSGVLLADPRKTSTIDRPVVFHVGLSSDWSEKPGNEPWNNQEKIESVRYQDFESLIQSGDKSVYMVEESLVNGETRPCHYFNELDKDFSFENEKVEMKSCKTSDLENSSFDMVDVSVESKDFVLSQSSLNDLVISPRVFYMSRLVSDVEEEAMKKGSLFHDFAELYFNEPEKTSEMLDKLTDIFVDEMRPIIDEVSIRKLETELRIGLKRLISFLEDKEPYEGNHYCKMNEYPNRFEQELGIDLETNSTEMTFNDSDMDLTGKIDLVTSDDHLIDYKSGRKYSEKQIVEKSRVETASDQRYPDLQALMYITQHAKHCKGVIKFSFVYFLEDLGKEVNGEQTDGFVSTVKYYPEKFDEKASQIEVFESLFNDVKKSNNRRKTLEKLSYTPYSDFLEEKDFPNVYTKEELSETQYLDDFVSMCVKEVGDYKYVRKGAKSALNKLIEFRQTNFFKEDIENFKQFITQKQKDLENYEKEGYPVGDREISELPKHDMVVE